MNKMRRGAINLVVTLLVLALFPLVNAQTYDVISSGKDWFVCNAMGNAPNFGDLPNPTQYVSEYKSFVPQFTDGGFSCINALNKLYAKIYPNDPFELDSGCGGLEGGTCCKPDDGEEPSYDVGSLVSKCGQYCYINNKYVSNMDADNPVCTVDPSLPTCGGRAGGESATTGLVEKKICGFTLNNCISSGMYDTSKTCSEQTGHNPCAVGDYCLNGVLVYSADDINVRTCCFGEGASCGDFDGGKSCEEQGGHFSSTPTLETCSGEVANTNCCMGGRWSAAGDYILYASNYANDSFICYKEQGNNLFSECCNDESCFNLDEGDSIEDNHFLAEGATLHTLENFDRYRGGFIVDLVAYYLNQVNGLTSEFKIDERITDWSTFNYLEFDIAATSFSTAAGVAGVRNVLLGGASLGRLNLYLTTDPIPMRWHHVIIPISALGYTSSSGYAKLEFDFEGAVPTDILIDNIFLRSIDITQNSENRYCAGWFGKWVDDLDPPAGATTYKEFGPYKLACQAQAAYGWTGDNCCGDDTTKSNAGEFFEENKGCFDGITVFNDWTVANATNDYSAVNRKLLFYNKKYNPCKDITSVTQRESYTGTASTTFIVVSADIKPAFDLLGSWYCGFDSVWAKRIANDTVLNSNGYSLLYLNNEFISCNRTVTGNSAIESVEVFNISGSWYCGLDQTWRVVSDLIDNFVDNAITLNASTDDPTHVNILFNGSEFLSCNTTIQNSLSRDVDLVTSYVQLNISNNWLCGLHNKWVQDFVPLDQGNLPLSDFTGIDTSPTQDRSLLFDGTEFLSCAETLPGVLVPSDHRYRNVFAQDGSWYCGLNHSWVLKSDLSPSPITLNASTNVALDSRVLFNNTNFVSCNASIYETVNPNGEVFTDSYSALLAFNSNWLCYLSHSWSYFNPASRVNTRLSDFTEIDSLGTFDRSLLFNSSYEWMSCNRNINDTTKVPAGANGTFIDVIDTDRFMKLFYVYDESGDDWFCGLNHSWVDLDELRTPAIGAENAFTLDASTGFINDSRVLYNASKVFVSCNTTIRETFDGDESGTNDSLDDIGLIEYSTLLGVNNDWLCYLNHSWLYYDASAKDDTVLADFTYKIGSLNEFDRSLLYLNNHFVSCDRNVNETLVVENSGQVVVNSSFSVSDIEFVPIFNYSNKYYCGLNHSWIPKSDFTGNPVYSANGYAITLNYSTNNDLDSNVLYISSDKFLSCNTTIFETFDGDYNGNSIVSVDENVDFFSMNGTWFCNSDHNWSKVFELDSFDVLPDQNNRNSILYDGIDFLACGSRPKHVANEVKIEDVFTIQDDWYCALNHTWVNTSVVFDVDGDGMADNTTLSEDTHNVIPDMNVLFDIIPESGMNFYSCNSSIIETYNAPLDKVSYLINSSLLEIRADWFCNLNNTWIEYVNDSRLADITSNYSDEYYSLLFLNGKFLSCAENITDSKGATVLGSQDLNGRYKEVFNQAGSWYCGLNHTWVNKSGLTDNFLPISTGAITLNASTAASDLNDSRVLFNSTLEFTSCDYSIYETVSPKEEVFTDSYSALLGFNNEWLCYLDHEWVFTDGWDFNRKLLAQFTLDYGDNPYDRSLFYNPTYGRFESCGRAIYGSSGAERVCDSVDNSCDFISSNCTEIVSICGASPHTGAYTSDLCNQGTDVSNFCTGVVGSPFCDNLSYYCAEVPDTNYEDYGSTVCIGQVSACNYYKDNVCLTRGTGCGFVTNTNFSICKDLTDACNEVAAIGYESAGFHEVFEVVTPFYCNLDHRWRKTSELSQIVYPQGITLNYSTSNPDDVNVLHDDGLFYSCNTTIRETFADFDGVYDVVIPPEKTLDLLTFKNSWLCNLSKVWENQSYELTDDTRLVDITGDWAPASKDRSLLYLNSATGWLSCAETITTDDGDDFIKAGDSNYREVFNQTTNWYCGLNHTWLNKSYYFDVDGDNTITSVDVITLNASTNNASDANVLFNGTPKFVSCNTSIYETYNFNSPPFDLVNADSYSALLAFNSNWLCYLSHSWLPDFVPLTQVDTRLSDFTGVDTLDTQDRSLLFNSSYEWMSCDRNIKDTDFVPDGANGTFIDYLDDRYRQIFDIHNPSGTSDYYCGLNHSWINLTMGSKYTLNDDTAEINDSRILFNGSNFVSCNTTIRETFDGEGSDDGEKDAARSGNGGDDGVNKWLDIDTSALSGKKLWIYVSASLCNSSAAETYHIKVNDNPQTVDFNLCEMFGMASDYAAGGVTWPASNFEWKSFDIPSELLVDGINKFNFYDLSHWKWSNWAIGTDTDTDVGDSAWSSDDSPTCQPVRGTNPLRQDGSCYNEALMIRFAVLPTDNIHKVVQTHDYSTLLSLNNNWLCYLNHSWFDFISVSSDTILEDVTHNTAEGDYDRSLLYYGGIFRSCARNINQTISVEDGGQVVVNSSFSVSDVEYVPIFNYSNNYFCGLNHSWVLKSDLTSNFVGSGITLNASTDVDIDSRVLFNNTNFVSCNTTIFETFDGDESGINDSVDTFGLITHVPLLAYTNDWLCYLDHEWRYFNTNSRVNTRLSDFTEIDSLGTFDRSLLFNSSYEWMSCGRNINDTIDVPDGSNGTFIDVIDTDRFMKLFYVYDEFGDDWFCGLNHSWIDLDDLRTPAIGAEDAFTLDASTGFINDSRVLYNASKVFVSCNATIRETFDGNESGTNDSLDNIGLIKYSTLLGVNNDWLCYLNHSWLYYDASEKNDKVLAEFTDKIGSLNETDRSLLYLNNHFISCDRNVYQTVSVEDGGNVVVNSAFSVSDIEFVPIFNYSTDNYCGLNHSWMDFNFDEWNNTVLASKTNVWDEDRLDRSLLFLNGEFLSCGRNIYETFDGNESGINNSQINGSVNSHLFKPVFNISGDYYCYRNHTWLPTPDNNTRLNDSTYFFGNDNNHYFSSANFPGDQNVVFYNNEFWTCNGSNTYINETFDGNENGVYDIVASTTGDNTLHRYGIKGSWYCYDDGWRPLSSIPKTRIIAARLMEIGEENASGDYSLHCGPKEDIMNNPVVSSGSGYDPEKFATVDFCVLKYGENATNVTIGVGLANDIDINDFLNEDLRSFHPMLSELDDDQFYNCTPSEGWVEFDYDHFFQPCDRTGEYFKVSYNKPFNIAIFTLNEHTPGNFLLKFWDAIKEFFANLFGKEQLLLAFSLPDKYIIDSDFDELFINKQGERMIKATREGDYDIANPTEDEGHLVVQYKYYPNVSFLKTLTELWFTKNTDPYDQEYFNIYYGVDSNSQYIGVNGSKVMSFEWNYLTSNLVLPEDLCYDSINTSTGYCDSACGAVDDCDGQTPKYNLVVGGTTSQYCDSACAVVDCGDNAAVADASGVYSCLTSCIVDSDCAISYSCNSTGVCEGCTGNFETENPSLCEANCGAPADCDGEQPGFAYGVGIKNEFGCNIDCGEASCSPYVFNTTIKDCESSASALSVVACDDGYLFDESETKCISCTETNETGGDNPNGLCESNCGAHTLCDEKLPSVSLVDGSVSQFCTSSCEVFDCEDSGYNVDVSVTPYSCLTSCIVDSDCVSGYSCDEFVNECKACTNAQGMNYNNLLCDSACGAVVECDEREPLKWKINDTHYCNASCQPLDCVEYKVNVTKFNDEGVYGCLTSCTANDNCSGTNICTASACVAPS